MAQKVKKPLKKAREREREREREEFYFFIFSIAYYAKRVKKFEKFYFIPLLDFSQLYNQLINNHVQAVRASPT